MSAERTFKFVALDAIGPSHRTMRVYANGASAGLLTLRADTGEAAEFERRVSTQPQLVRALQFIDAELTEYLAVMPKDDTSRRLRDRARTALMAATS